MLKCLPVKQIGKVMKFIGGIYKGIKIKKIIMLFLLVQGQASQ
jgi:hypothetical protein